MAFRRIENKKRSKKLSVFYKSLLITFSVCALFIFSILIFVNGNTIKGSLENFIANKLKADVSIESVEFSPLYPNTLKLTNVNLDKEKINEVFVELDLTNLLFKDSLIFDYLYLKKPSYTLQEIQDFLSDKTKFNKVFASRIRIDNVEIDDKNLKSKDSNINLYNVSFDKEIAIASAMLALENGSLFKEKFKSLSFDYRKEGNTVSFNNIQARLSGGNIIGSLIYDTESHDLELKDAVLSNLIIKNTTPFLHDFKIHADKVQLNNIIYENKDKKLLISGIQGYIHDFSNKENLSFNYEGNISEIVKSDIKETFRNLHLSTSYINGDYTFSSKGLVSLGRFDVNGEYKSNDNKFSFYKLDLNKAKIEFDDNLYNYIYDNSKKYNFNIQSINILNSEFLSFVNELPVSVKDLSLSLTNINVEDGKVHGNKAGLITFDAKSFLYSDLYLKKVFALSTITDNLITLSIPDLTFVKSSISLAGDISLDKGKSYLSISAKDFNLSELNSNLIPNLFAGNIDLDIELKSGHIDRLKEEMEGSISIKSEQLLISKLGLDLINGGEMRELKIGKSKDFLKMLSLDDLGGENLSLEGKIEKGVIDNTLSLNSSTAHIDGKLKYDLVNNEATGKINFISKSKDSITNLHIKKQKDDEDFNYHIVAVKRGEMRPGLDVDILANQDEKESDTDKSKTQDGEKKDNSANIDDTSSEIIAKRNELILQLDVM